MLSIYVLGGCSILAFAVGVLAEKLEPTGPGRWIYKVWWIVAALCLFAMLTGPHIEVIYFWVDTLVSFTGFVFGRWIGYWSEARFYWRIGWARFVYVWWDQFHGMDTVFDEFIMPPQKP